MAKAKKKQEVEETTAQEAENDDEELDLEELAEETEDEPAPEADETDDEENTSKKQKKGKKKKSSRPRSTGRAEGTIGTGELAEALETDGKNLRIMLRDRETPKNENNRYEWSSIKEALKALKFKTVQEAKDALAESRNKRLDVLKKQQEEKRAVTGEKKKTSKQKKKEKAKK